MQDLNRENFKALLKYILKDYGNYDICNIMGQKTQQFTDISSLHTDVCSKNIPMETPIVSFFVCVNYEVLIISNLYEFEIAKTFMKNKLT